MKSTTYQKNVTIHASKRDLTNINKTFSWLLFFPTPHPFREEKKKKTFLWCQWIYKIIRILPRGESTKNKKRE